ncbi:MAG: hypothetical protein CMN76_04745 [Spirochaetaceae bacterium]|nr:hypothetical protein [Spirochaetaceae bacterium]
MQTGWLRISEQSQANPTMAQLYSGQLSCAFLKFLAIAFQFRIVTFSGIPQGELQTAGSA